MSEEQDAIVPEAAKSAKQPRTPEQREYTKIKRRESRSREKAREDKSARLPKSDLEIKKKEAIEILQKERLIRNQRVAEVCYELATVAAANLRLPLNAHLFTHGVAKTLEAVQTKKAVAPPEINDVWAPGNRIREHEIAALYDYGMSWREINGKKYTLDEFKELRRACVEDLFRFGRDVLGLDLHEQPHGEWANEMFVQKRDLLPEKYTWEDVKVALAEQSDIHQRMLIASRSSYKSSVNLVDLLQWVLAFGGDIRIFIISSTAPLSAGFLRKFRSYWTVKNPNEPSLFNLLFPEFMIHPGDDPGPAKNFVSPMRQLDLIQPTLTSTSLDSEGLAGERMDVFVAEDVAEISNSANPEQRAKTLEKFDLLRELLEPFGYLQVVCTPISSGSGTEEDPGDIYATLLRREDAHRKDGGEPRLLHMICPAWAVKPEVKKAAWDLSLVEDEVELLFPTRLTFKYLKAKLRESEKTFRQQSLCSWVPDEDESLRLQFDLDTLRASLVNHQAQLGDGEMYLLADVAFSTSKYSDRSVVAAIRTFQNVSGQKCIVVLGMKAGRWRGSELALEIVMMSRRFPQARTCIMERPHSSDLLKSAVDAMNAKYNTTIQLYFTNSPNTKDAKMLKLKSLELAFTQGLIKIISSDFVDELFQELQRLNGATSTKSKKDDRADVLGMAAQMFIRPEIAGGKEDPEADAMREKVFKENMKNAQYQRIFGNQVQQQPPKPSVVEPPQPRDDRYRVFGRNGSRGPWRL